MFSILYSSDAAYPLGEVEINHILDKARARNIEAGVTGILLHKNGHFLQYIEGAELELARIFQIIQENKQHNNLKVIFYRPVSQRLFPEWSMAYQSKELEVYSDEEVYFSLLYPALNTNEGDASKVSEALNQFWQG
jgi:hypothetical protein